MIIVVQNLSADNKEAKFENLAFSNVQYAHMTNSSNITSVPIDRDLLAMSTTSNRADKIIIGNIQIVNDPTMKKGEIKLGSRNNETGEDTIFIKFSETGKLLIDTEAGKAGNDFLVFFNQLQTIMTTLKNDLNIFINRFNSHTHVVLGVTTGNETSSTDATGLTVPAIDIDLNPAKIENVEVNPEL